MYFAAGLLAIAIAAEVGATAALPRAEGFTNAGWGMIVVTGYALSIWLLTLVVKAIPVSVTYAIWAGLGTAAIAVIGVIFLNEPLNTAKVVALGLIIGGVVLLNVNSAH